MTATTTAANHCVCVFGVWKKEREEFVRPLGNRRRAVSNAKRKNGI